MAGASVISALLNALGRRDLPFVFGGDGALVAVPGAAWRQPRETLAATQAWVADELGLTLRAAIVPMTTIRAQRPGRARRAVPGERPGLLRDVHRRRRELGRGRDEGRPLRRRPPRRPARGPTSPACPAAGTRSRRGTATSSRSSPCRRRRRRPAAFQALVADIVRARRRAGARRPSGAADGPDVALSVAGRRASRRAPLAPRRQAVRCRSSRILAQIALTCSCSRARPAARRASIRASTGATSRDNSDFRKFDDGLKMTRRPRRGRLSAAIEERLQRGRGGRHLPVRPAPAEFGADDLHRRHAAAARPHPFHRRGAGRLCDGGGEPQGEGCRRHALTMPCRDDGERTSVRHSSTPALWRAARRARRPAGIPQILRQARRGALGAGHVGGARPLSRQETPCCRHRRLDRRDALLGGAGIAKAVVAVEPDPDCVAILRAACAGAPDVTVLEGALSRQAERSRSTRSTASAVRRPACSTSAMATARPWPASASTRSWRMPAEAPAFVKIDIEGYEFCDRRRTRAASAPSGARHRRSPSIRSSTKKASAGSRLLARLRTALATWRLGRLFAGSFSGPRAH